MDIYVPILPIPPTPPTPTGVSDPAPMGASDPPTRDRKVHPVFPGHDAAWQPVLSFVYLALKKNKNQVHNLKKDSSAVEKNLAQHKSVGTIPWWIETTKADGRLVLFQFPFHGHAHLSAWKCHVTCLDRSSACSIYIHISYSKHKKTHQTSQPPINIYEDGLGSYCFFLKISGYICIYLQHVLSFSSPRGVTSSFMDFDQLLPQASSKEALGSSRTGYGLRHSKN